MLYAALMALGLASLVAAVRGSAAATPLFLAAAAATSAAFVADVTVRLTINL
jgi:polyisoprenoid-binding protein YceI